jgi:outer membrane immunogenic protein
MKKCLTFAVVLTAVTGLTIGFAGPQRYESSNKEVTPLAPCDWSGFYIGLNAGVGQYTSDIRDDDGFNNDNQDGSSYITTQTDINGLVGGQVGFNWQKGAAVFGLEADGDWTGFSVHDHENTDITSDFLSHRSEINFMGTVRGRLGLAYENVLVYVTGGVAFAQGDRAVHFAEETTFINPPEESAKWVADDFRVGLVGGVGVEYMANCHWSVRAETLFTTFDKDSANDSIHQDAEGSSQTFQDEVFMVRLGVNYKFGGGR